MTRQRSELASQLENPDITEVHVGEIEITAFYPYIFDAKVELEPYYGKTIICDGE